MSQPVTIDNENRRITFQMGRVIPTREARADLHRLLEMALDALETSKPMESEDENHPS